MARRSQITILVALALVRSAQRKAAELAVAQSDEQLRSAQVLKQLADDELAEREASWSAAVASPVFNLAQVGAWTTAVLAGQADLERAVGEVDQAQSNCLDKRKDWSKAWARAQVADTLRARAERRFSRRNEEVRLADQADRSARQGARP